MQLCFAQTAASGDAAVMTASGGITGTWSGEVKMQPVAVGIRTVSASSGAVGPAPDVMLTSVQKVRTTNVGENSVFSGAHLCWLAQGQL